MRVLILGGTGDARELADLLVGDARFSPLLSLAGRTSTPAPQPIPTRIGGFGGASGLAQFLIEHQIHALVDATHPFAVKISANAVEAAALTNVPLGTIVRPAWIQRSDDTWTRAASAKDAAIALGTTPKRVFLTVGRLEIKAFAAMPQHDYIARTIEPIHAADAPTHLTVVQARPPFSLPNEVEFLRTSKTQILVSKNSGGPQTFAKIEAARLLRIPVVMIDRPPKPQGFELESPSTARGWLEWLADHTSSPLGV